MQTMQLKLGATVEAYYKDSLEKMRQKHQEELAQAQANIVLLGRKDNENKELIRALKGETLQSKIKSLQDELYQASSEIKNTMNQNVIQEQNQRLKMTGPKILS